MNLYCISIFLEKGRINKFLQNCRCEKIEYKEIEIIDQVNEKEIGYQADFSGLKVLILPCNDFHKNKDFEIGITEQNPKKWNDFVERAKSESVGDYKAEYGKFADGKTEYFLIKDKEYHGNFFFIYDGQNSKEESLLKIECTMTKHDLDFYQNQLKNLIGENIASKIDITATDKFELNRLIIKSAEKNLVLEV